MCCHPERSEGSLYEVPTSSPWMCTNIVATGSNGCSPWKQHHGSLADLRCQETGGVTRLVTHTGLSRSAARCFPFATLRASAHALSMTGRDLSVEEELSRSFEPCLKFIIVGPTFMARDRSQLQGMRFPSPWHDEDF